MHEFRAYSYRDLATRSVSLEKRRDIVLLRLLIGLTQKTSQTLIPPCRASCCKSGNPPNAREQCDFVRSAKKSAIAKSYFRAADGDHLRWAGTPSQPALFVYAFNVSSNPLSIKRILPSSINQVSIFLPFAYFLGFNLGRVQNSEIFF